MNRTLIVFAKEPVLGTVKTRLKDSFSDEDLVNLYKAFIQDTLDIARSVPCEKRILAFSSTSTPSFLKEVGSDFELVKQEGEDLGKRMHNAFAFSKGQGSEKTIIIGSDSPILPQSVIDQSFSELDKCDLVVGPAMDGGYYLIGMKEPCWDLFEGIAWSGPEVFSQTQKKAKILGKTMSSLEVLYDVDDNLGLTRLRRDLEDKITAKHTRKALGI